MFKALPKIELHCHLDASVRVQVTEPVFYDKEATRRDG
jgi:adenosine deaminase